MHRVCRFTHQELDGGLKCALCAALNIHDYAKHTDRLSVCVLQKYYGT